MKTIPFKHIFIMGIIISFLVVSSCNTTEPPPPSTTVPSAPSNLEATAVSSTQINLSWKDNSNNEEGFKIERAPYGTTNFSVIKNADPNTTSHQNTGLTAATCYIYRVMGYNSSGSSNYSNTDTATTHLFTLTITPSNQKVTNESGSTNFTVTSNTSWSVSSDAAWLIVSPENGSNNGNLTATYTANTTLIQRVGTITVSGGGLKRTATVIQAAVPQNEPDW